MATLPVVAFVYAVLALSMPKESKAEVIRPSECESGWNLHGNRCFKYFSTAESWSEAEGVCVNHGGHLASIHNKHESRFVAELSNNTPWVWIGGGGSGFTWYWTDGTPFDYSNWKAWEPNNANGNEHCLTINFIGEDGGGVWNDGTCHVKCVFVCAK